MPTILKSSTAGTLGDMTRVRRDQANRSFQLTVAGTGSVGAVVNVYGSNDGVVPLLLATITIPAAASPVSDGFVSQAAWDYVQAKLVSITGTGAMATLTMGS